MLCLKCEQKEALRYSEKCADCENKDLGFLWVAVIALAILVISIVFQLIQTINLSVMLMNYSYYYLFIPVIFEFVGLSLLLALAIYTCKLFWQRNKKLPLIFIILVVSNLIFYLLDLAITSYIYEIKIDSSLLPWFIKSFAFTIFWSCYFLISEKAKKVFIN
ncbi:DUF2569 family protein [Zophobihabitans entericus]|uniref:DUF2569 domain-containing protein n=1 Tax=Zophobihabitans entericus TaxID=1635327 RepID=A0A6G9ICS9_9GAMM|nr:DUF2569 family protein [Zophobihabitans entericus]QIQ22041.1 DUF2569 domain-containing protein [Zophobihabitans entericus]